MSKILSIAEKRIDGGLQRLLEELASNYSAMLRMHSSKGSLRSGNTVKQTMNLVSACADSLRDLVAAQSKWVINESIYVPLSISEELISICTKYFDVLAEQSESYIRKASEMSGKTSIFDRVYPDVKSGIARSFDEAQLEIEALVASNHSRGIKGVAKYIFSIVSKLWGA